MGRGKKLTQEEAIKQFREAHGDEYDYSKVKYVNNKTKVEIICPIHGSFYQIPFNHKNGKGCCYCSGRKTHINDSIGKKRPDLIKYFVDEKDTFKHTPYSNKKVKLKCPDCGFEKYMVLRDLSRHGFSCLKCSDGISVPEKFMVNLLCSLKIDFQTQYNPEWSENKRYDFYIDDLKMIIETHGNQHYQQSGRGCLLQEEQENDKFKKDLALKNRVKNYIVVNCRKSTLKWLKENCLKELSSYFDLSNVDWNKIWSKCQNSLVKEVCEVWNSKERNEATTDIARKLNLSAGTVLSYLNRGKDLGWCDYNGQEELLKHKSRLKRINSKKVCQYTLNGDFIKQYTSLIDASKQTNVPSPNIVHCCQDRRKTAGGYIWKYAE